MAKKILTSRNPADVVWLAWGDRKIAGAKARKAPPFTTLFTPESDLTVTVCYGGPESHGSYTHVHRKQPSGFAFYDHDAGSLHADGQGRVFAGVGVSGGKFVGQWASRSGLGGASSMTLVEFLLRSRGLSMHCWSEGATYLPQWESLISPRPAPTPGTLITNEIIRHVFTDTDGSVRVTSSYAIHPVDTREGDEAPSTTNLPNDGEPFDPDDPLPIDESPTVYVRHYRIPDGSPYGIKAEVTSFSTATGRAVLSLSYGGGVASGVVAEPSTITVDGAGTVTGGTYYVPQNTTWSASGLLFSTSAPLGFAVRLENGTYKVSAGSELLAGAALATITVSGRGVDGLKSGEFCCLLSYFVSENELTGTSAEDDGDDPSFKVFTNVVTGSFPLDGYGSRSIAMEDSLALRSSKFTYDNDKYSLRVALQEKQEDKTWRTEASSATGTVTNGYARYVDEYMTFTQGATHPEENGSYLVSNTGNVNYTPAPRVPHVTITTSDASASSANWLEWQTWTHEDIVGVITGSITRSVTTAGYGAAGYRDVFGNSHYEYRVSFVTNSEATLTLSTPGMWNIWSGAVQPLDTASVTTLGDVERMETGGEEGDPKGRFCLPELGIHIDEQGVYVRGTGIVLGEKSSAFQSFPETEDYFRFRTPEESDELPPVHEKYDYDDVEIDWERRDVRTLLNKCGIYGGQGGSTSNSLATDTENRTHDGEEPYSVAAIGAFTLRRPTFALFVYPGASQTFAAIFFTGLLLPCITAMKNITTAADAKWRLPSFISSLETTRQYATADQYASAWKTTSGDYTAAISALSILRNSAAAIPASPQADAQWAAMRDAFVATHLPYQRYLLWANADATALLPAVTRPGVFVAGPIRFAP